MIGASLRMPLLIKCCKCTRNFYKIKGRRMIRRPSYQLLAAISVEIYCSQKSLAVTTSIPPGKVATAALVLVGFEVVSFGG